MWLPKDGRHSCPQTFLGLLVASGGNPIGYEIYEGNISEGHTMIPLIRKLASRFGFDKPIVVADAGLLSKANIEELTKDGYQYILGARPKSESEKVKEQILSLGMKYGDVVEIEKGGQSRFGALFKSVKGATIKNLHVTGSIDGTGNSDGKLLAGIVGVSYGTTTITNCRSSVTLTTDLGSDAALAGIVAATKGGRLTITDCVFDSSMTGETNTRCAGIAGYEYNATTTTISNCLFVPAELTVSTAADKYTKTFSRDGDATISHCYYTVALGRAQGTLVYTTAPDDLLTERRQLIDGNDYYIPCTVSDAETANIVDTRSASVTLQELGIAPWVTKAQQQAQKVLQLVTVRVDNESAKVKVSARRAQSQACLLCRGAA